MDVPISNLQISELSNALTTVAEAQYLLDNFLPVVSRVQMNAPKLESRGEDLISKSILPQDFKDWTPLVSSGDGNCLFNSASILLAGDESLAGVLRLLTVSELFANAEFYANHPQLEAISGYSGYSLPALFLIFLSNEKAQSVYNGKVDQMPQAIKVLAKETAKPFAYSSTFHILALSSVIDQPISSVYPDIATCVTIKKALHRVFYPRKGLVTAANNDYQQSNALPIMWTRAQASSLIRSWQPNHFVPLISKSTSVFHASSYANIVNNEPVYSQRLPATKQSHDSMGVNTGKRKQKFPQNCRKHALFSLPLSHSSNKESPRKTKKKVQCAEKAAYQTPISPVTVLTEPSSIPTSTSSSSNKYVSTDEYARNPNQAPLSSGEVNPFEKTTVTDKMSSFDQPSDVVAPPTSSPLYTQLKDETPRESRTTNSNDVSSKPPIKQSSQRNIRKNKKLKDDCVRKPKATLYEKRCDSRPNVQRKRRKPTTEVQALDAKTPKKLKEKHADALHFRSYFISSSQNGDRGEDKDQPTTIDATVTKIREEKSSKKEEETDKYSKERKKEMQTDQAKGNEAGKEEEEEILPLTAPNLQWYKEKGINALTNITRTEERLKNSVVFAEGQMKGLVRGHATGTLSKNIDALVQKLISAGSVKQQQHLTCMMTMAKHILENALVPTQELAKMYKEAKALKESSRIESSHVLDMMSKHLNVAQIYVAGKGYIIENHGEEVMKVLNTVQSMEKDNEETVRRKVEQVVGNSYKTTMEYLDSKRDRDTLKAILTNITSVNFMANLADVQDKRSFRRSKDLVAQNIQLFEQIKMGLDEIDTNLTGEEKRRKKYRMLQKLKLENLRHVFKGRGRNLKCEEFPDLCGILEFAFGEGDRVDRAGGGLESHPRLTDTVLYRAADNNTIMKNARETILALAPEGFSISLSSCFNYTQNYKEGTYQAKRHHSGRGINACISLHKPPRTGVEQFVINLHWSTQNVNLSMDYAHLIPNNMLVDSRDAKAKIQADVSPVQRPGKTWRKIILPDHDWSRTTYNAITPMTHLFLQTDLNHEGDEEEGSFYTVRRTGRAATSLNISYFERETVHRVFNEIFLLMVNPGLDQYFRNHITGRLKEHFVFIVDNGPSEAPSNPLVKMWLIRLARVLKLKSVTQKSFAEYHSKRNPVERVHAVHNSALSNEQFSSKAVHEKYEIGDQRHLENMEHMAEEIVECLSKTQYGGRPCLVLRGIGNEEKFFFNDEANLVTFLGKSEGRKNEDILEYQPTKSDLWREVATLWDLDEDFHGSYREDYQIMLNVLEEEGELTCWSDKYSTTIFNPAFEHDYVDRKNLTMQPIPDYVRWFTTGGEMHYFTLEKLQNLDSKVIDETPGAFLPSKILQLTFKVFRHGLESVLPSISFLSWCTEDDVRKFTKEFTDKLDETFTNDKEKEYWSQDEWYRNFDKAQLQDRCKKNGISAEGRKHECLRRISEKLNRALPPLLENYNGKLISIPSSVSDIAKLSVYRLREILRFHNILDSGIKDELALRVAMLKAGRSHLAFHKELEAIINIISATRTLIQKQKEMYLEDPTIIYKRRKFSTAEKSSVCTSKPRENASVVTTTKGKRLPVPENITFSTIEDVLEPLDVEIGLYRKVGKELGKGYDRDTELESIRTVGARVLVMWNKNEIAASGWRTGWFAGSVMSYRKESDTVEIQFDTEKGVKYEYVVKEELYANRIKLAKSSKSQVKDYEDICQIGAEVEMKWEKADLIDTDWQRGWYDAEVQSVDYDDDEIDIVFVEEPECVYTIAVLPNLLSGNLRLKQNLF